MFLVQTQITPELQLLFGLKNITTLNSKLSTLQTANHLQFETRQSTEDPCSDLVIRLSPCKERLNQIIRITCYNNSPCKIDPVESQNESQSEFLMQQNPDKAMWILFNDHHRRKIRQNHRQY